MAIPSSMLPKALLFTKETSKVLTRNIGTLKKEKVENKGIETGMEKENRQN